LLGMAETPPPVPAVATVSVPAVLPPAMQAVPTTPAEVAPAPVANDLKLAQGVSVLPMPAAPVLPVPDPVASPPREIKPEAPPAKNEAAALKVAAATNTGPVSIEKSPVL